MNEAPTLPYILVQLVPPLDVFYVIHSIIGKQNVLYSVVGDRIDTMPIKSITHKLLHTNCHIIRLLTLLSMFCAVFFLQAQAVAYADGVPGGNIADPVVRAVDVATPAVVRIITDVPSKLTVHFSQTTSVTFPQTGDPYPEELSGSGAFISSHGDILTADHVVNPPHDASLSQYLDTLAAPDVATLYQSAWYATRHSRSGVTGTTNKPNSIRPCVRLSSQRSIL